MSGAWGDQFSLANAKAIRAMLVAAEAAIHNAAWSLFLLVVMGSGIGMSPRRQAGAAGRGVTAGVTAL
jgi:hypothetical protein